MTEFAQAVAAATKAQREAYDAIIERDNAYAARNRALARAWRHRPDALTWAELVRLVCEPLPEGARFTVSAARWAARQGGGS